MYLRIKNVQCFDIVWLKTGVVQFKVMTTFAITSSLFYGFLEKSLNWQIGGDIILLTFGKFGTSSIQQLQILGKKLTCSQYLGWQFLLSLNILNFWTYDIKNFTLNWIRPVEKLQTVCYWTRIMCAWCVLSLLIPLILSVCKVLRINETVIPGLRV